MDVQPVALVHLKDPYYANPHPDALYFRVSLEPPHDDGQAVAPPTRRCAGKHETAE